MRTLNYLLLFIAPLLILVAIGYIYFNTYPKEWYFREFSGFENLPPVSWTDLRTGKWAKFIREKATSNINKAVANRYVVKDFKAKDDAWLTKYGFKSLEIDGSEILSATSGEKLPAYLLGNVFITKLESSEYFVFPQIWINKDKYISVTTYIFRRDINGQIGLETLLDNSSKLFMLPILSFKNKTECLKYIHVEDTYCSWLEKNKFFIKVIQELTIKKNVVPRVISVFPLLPTSIKGGIE